MESLQTAPKEQYSNRLSIGRFAAFWFFSFGIYQVYWFYQNWKFIKERKQLDIKPVWRATFYIFFVYSQFQYIFALAKEKGYEKKYSAGLLTVVFLVLSFTYKLPDPYWLIFILTLVPIIPAQEALNYYWDQEQPVLKEKTGFSFGEILLFIFGGLFWLLVLIGVFLPVK